MSTTTLFDRLASAFGLGEGCSPYEHSSLPPADTSSYPHTHLPEALVSAVLRELAAGRDEPMLVVELGSFVGGSASRIARALSAAEVRDAAVLCVDPFCGDANMWSDVNGWRAWMRLRHGQPALFEQFVANMLSLRLERVVLPLCTTSIIGLSVLRRLTM
eukprot:3867442-Prymnesium_polylepis.1